MIYPSFTIINTNAPVGENNGDFQDFHLGDLMMANDCENDISFEIDIMTCFCKQIFDKYSRNI